MADYDLRYLVRVLTSDGRVWQQTPADLSVRFPEIELLNPETGVVEHTLRPEDAPEIAAQIRSGDRPIQVLHEGRLWDWHTKSASADFQDYQERGEIVECALLEAPTVGCGVTALIRLLPIPEEVSDFALEPGDILILRSGTDTVAGAPVIIPFSLPDRLWPKDEQGKPTRPPLRLVCHREVMREVVPGDRLLGVDYMLGWEATVGAHTYRHVITVV